MSKRKLIYNIGINDIPTPPEWYDAIGNRIRCPYYRRWHHMMQRAYSTKYQVKNPTYIGVTVCEDWHRLSTFKAWMVMQDWEGKELDKDIRIPGNRIYKPEACLFVEKKINNIFGKTLNRDLPEGVYIIKPGYQAVLNKKYLGYFGTINKASKAYQIGKINYINSIIESTTDIRLASGLSKHLDILKAKYEL